MFHEFGHGLHGMLSRAKYKSQAGTNTDRDFVELPSQIHEHWAMEPELLKSFARHYKTGETIPDDLIAKLQAASTHNQGFTTTELAGAALLDLNGDNSQIPTLLTWSHLNAKLHHNSTCLQKYSTVTAALISNMYSAATSIPADITLICGPKYWIPTASNYSRKKAYLTQKQPVHSVKTFLKWAAVKIRWNCS